MNLLVRRSAMSACAALSLFAGTVAAAADDNLETQAQDALRRAVRYLADEVSAEGGYLWVYSADLTRRAGENPAGPRTVWIEPPGTPAVGDALLRAYQNTGDRFYLDQARRTADCLIRGQLHSGGWANQIEFDPEQRKLYAYRVDGTPVSRARNLTTLDDNKTQSALRFLMRLDRVLNFEDPAVHEAVTYALDKLLEAQYPNGAWPQQFSGPPDAAAHPVLSASYPESWSREYPKASYTGHYTFNDNSMGDCVDVLLMAAQIYDEPRYRTAAERCGDFMRLAQMPDPQPAWAQQYDAQMHPAWARRFEPPSITGGESQGVIAALLRLYQATGEERFLEPVPRALAYLKSCELPDGRLPRFIELQTNRPLYFTKDYVLTYDDSDVPTHYGFKVSSKLDQLAAQYERLKQLPADQLSPPVAEFRLPRMSQALADAARQAIAAQDEKGRWFDSGRLPGGTGELEPVISMRTYIRNIDALATYLGAARAARQ